MFYTSYALPRQYEHHSMCNFFIYALSCSCLNSVQSNKWIAPLAWTLHQSRYFDTQIHFLSSLYFLVDAQSSLFKTSDALSFWNSPNSLSKAGAVLSYFACWSQSPMLVNPQVRVNCFMYLKLVSLEFWGSSLKSHQIQVLLACRKHLYEPEEFSEQSWITWSSSSLSCSVLHVNNRKATHFWISVLSALTTFSPVFSCLFCPNYSLFIQFWFCYFLLIMFTSTDFEGFALLVSYSVPV